MSARAPMWFGSLSKLLATEYPQLTKARDLCTLELLYRGSYATLQTFQPDYGAAGSDDAAGFIVQTSKLKHGIGRKGELSITCVRGPDGGDVPPPKPDVKFVRIDLPLEKNKYFATLTDPSNSEYDADYSAKILAAVESALKATTPKDRLAARMIFDPAVDPNGVGDALATELYQKKLRGEDSYIAFYPHATLTTYSTSCPTDLNAGGTTGNPTSLIPFPDGYQWLRMGDELTKSSQFWELTEQWIGALEIDSDLYDN